LVIRYFIFNILTTLFRCYEGICIAILYYCRRPSFFWLDLLLAKHYILKSPHRLSKAFLMRKGAHNIYAYGETPLTTLDKIARRCRILSKDIVYDLGCGPGRTCFWLRTFVGCRAIGVDYVSDFIAKAKKVKLASALCNIEFLHQNMLDIDLSRATVIYLYGICLEDAVVENLILHLHSLKPGARVITVSYPLTEYCCGKVFRVVSSFPGRFPWGIAEIYLNERLNDNDLG
jgi:SAM-dependent methyltransferase